MHKIQFWWYECIRWILDTGHFPTPHAVLPVLHPMVHFHSFSTRFCISWELGIKGFVCLFEEADAIPGEMVQASQKLDQSWVCDLGRGVLTQLGHQGRVCILGKSPIPWARPKNESSFDSQACGD